MASKSKENKRSKGLWILLIVIVIALLVSAVIVLPQFYIAEYKVEGNRKIKEEELIKSSNIEEGKHLFYYISGDLLDYLSFRYADIEDNLEKTYPYIKDIKVKASFPYAVKFELKEEVEIAYILSNDEYIAINRDGKILDISKEKPSNPRVPIITGYILSEPSLAKKIPSDLERQIERTLVVLDNVLSLDKNSDDDFSLSERIVSFRPHKANSLYLQVLDNQGKALNVEINPNQNIQASLTWLRDNLSKGVLDELGPGILRIRKTQKVFSKNDKLPEAIREEIEVEEENLETDSTSSSTSAKESETTASTSKSTEGEE